MAILKLQVMLLVLIKRKRNVGIALGSRIGFAYVNPNAKRGGGTMHGISIAKSLDISVVLQNEDVILEANQENKSQKDAS